MKTFSFTLTIFGLYFAAVSVAYAGATTTSPGGSTDPSSVRPTDRIRSVDPTADPSTVRPADRIRPDDTTIILDDPLTQPDAGTIIRPGDPGATPNPGSTSNTRVIQPARSVGTVDDDPAQQKNEAEFRAAQEKCRAIVSKDSQMACMQEAESNFRNGRP